MIRVSVLLGFLYVGRKVYTDTITVIKQISLINANKVFKLMFLFGL